MSNLTEKDIERAWAAGFWDGEGSLIINGHWPRFCISQVELQPLQRFQSAAGVGRIYGPYHKGTVPNASPIYEYAVTNRRHIDLLIERVGPYLSEPKRIQIKETMSSVREPLRSRLGEEQVIEIKKRINLGDSTRDIAKDFEVSENTIYYIKSGRTWKEINV